ncbi:hypothetical protein F5B18DRAFT_426198 [Nemania serpens]|nr:hypothetical protein F5B18DRAFT_426198 [Nemania serpens]
MLFFLSHRFAFACFPTILRSSPNWSYLVETGEPALSRPPHVLVYARAPDQQQHMRQGSPGDTYHCITGNWVPGPYRQPLKDSSHP